MRRAAFTLIELLIVVAVIAVLLAILMPALAGARDAAWAVACASNLRQIDEGTSAFIAERNAWPVTWGEIEIDVSCPAPSENQASRQYQFWPEIEAYSFMGQRGDFDLDWAVRSHVTATGNNGGAEFIAQDAFELLFAGVQPRAHHNVLQPDHSVRREW